MKHITYKFTDGSEIDIDNKNQATILGSTTHFAYTLWMQSTKDQSIKTAHLFIFCSICEELHKKHGIVIEYTDHFTGITVNHFENLLKS